MDPPGEVPMDSGRWQLAPSQDNGCSSRVASFERHFERFKAEKQADLTPEQMDSLERALSCKGILGSYEGMDIHAFQGMILQELGHGAPGQDVSMDSMESVPSSIVNALLGTDKTSLPQMDVSGVEQTFTQEGASRVHPAPEEGDLAMSPACNQLESTYTTLERHNAPLHQQQPQPVVQHPVDQQQHHQQYQQQQMQQHPHPLQYHMAPHPRVDPNEEIHAGPGMPYPYQPQPPQQQQILFHSAMSARQALSVDAHDEVMSVRSTDSDESYKLSPENRLELTVYYSNVPVSGTVMVDRLEGCIMYYNKASQEYLEKCQPVPFPSLKNTEIGKKFEKVSSKALELTGKALDALQGGLRLHWSAEGVYAIRQSRGKIYWTSTQMGSDQPLAQELVRNTPTLVFKWEMFRLQLSKIYTLKAQHKKFTDPLLPAVYFTFAQKWARETCPISNCLVWARVIPKKAEEMVVGLFPEAKAAPYASINSGFLQMSNSSTASGIGQYHPS